MNHYTEPETATDTHPSVNGSLNSTINQHAPVIATGEIEVEASPEIVWDIMASIEEWPNWNPDISWASLNGQLAKGTTFRWKAGPGTITSTLQNVNEPSLLAWTGKTMGIMAVHIWRFETRNGGTIVRTEESWDGLLPRLFRGPMRKTLEESIENGLRFLKAESARRVARDKDQVDEGQ